MAILRTIDIGGKPINKYYKVYGCFPFRTYAKVELGFWYLSDADLENGIFPNAELGNFDGAEQFAAMDVPQQFDPEGNVIVEGSTVFTDYFSNNALLAQGSSPFKNAYLFVKTLPGFENSIDVDI